MFADGLFYLYLDLLVNLTDEQIAEKFPGLDKAPEMSVLRRALKSGTRCTDESRVDLSRTSRSRAVQSRRP